MAGKTPTAASMEPSLHGKRNPQPLNNTIKPSQIYICKSESRKMGSRKIYKRSSFSPHPGKTMITIKKKKKLKTATCCQKHGKSPNKTALDGSAAPPGQAARWRPGPRDRGCRAAQRRASPHEQLRVRSATRWVWAGQRPRQPRARRGASRLPRSPLPLRSLLRVFAPLGRAGVLAASPALRPSPSPQGPALWRQ